MKILEKSFMKKTKKISLSFLFAFYNTFMPFVFVNCGQDAAYDKTVSSSSSESPSASQSESDCSQNTFLTQDCVNNPPATAQINLEGQQDEMVEDMDNEADILEEEDDF